MKKGFINIIYFGVSFIIILTILELFISFSYIETQSSTDFTEEYGRCRRQNMDYVYFNEGFSMGTFNKGRYLNSYYPIAKPKNVIRIAALGDSYVEGFQVFERNHFLKIAENKLNISFRDSIQILNFGRSGFDFGDMYAYYDRMVKQYNCDYVMVFVSNVDLDIKQTDKLIPKVINSNGELVVINNKMPIKYKNKFIKQLVLSHNFTLYNMLNNGRKLVKAGQLLPKLFDKLYTKDKQIIENENSIAKFKVSNLTFRILSNLEKEKAQFIIINRDKEELESDFVSKIRKPIKYYDLTAKSVLYGNDFDPHYWNVTNKRGHWNLRGNKMVGEALWKYFIQIL